jgi:hypothetical protein
VVVWGAQLCASELVADAHAFVQSIQTVQQGQIRY